MSRCRSILPLISVRPVHVSVMGYYRFINFHQNRRGSGIFLGDFTWNDPYMLSELNHCPNFHIAMSKFPEIRGLAYCTRVARAQCTTTPRVMDQRKAFVELHQYAKFCVASSKFPESKGAYAYTLCTCITHALCTLSRNDMYHRITLIEFHKCTKFGVNRSKFPRTGGPLPNKFFRSWRAQPAPERNGNHKSIYAVEAYM